MKKTCIFQDTENIEKTKDLLEVAERMYGQGQFQSHAVLLEASSHCLHGSFHHIIRVAEGLVDAYDPRGISDVLENLHQRNRFDSILIPATSLGKMIAPRLAKRLGTGLSAGVTDVKRQKNRIEIIRPACSGKILEVIHHRGAGPVMMSIRPDAFEYRSRGGLQTQILEYTKPVTSRSTVQRLHVEENKLSYDIRESRVLISGGGGVKDDFPELFRLADALNGSVAASRKLVDQGIAPRSIQVGQSGKTVSPSLYMALGVHGTMQHIAGLRNIETIISVNRADNAPICSLSDIVVQGDAAEFIDRLMEKISIYRSEKKES
ncbi:electron transfer flavoprotein subunit alpha/FixB family protein [Desulfospira joergensenii]|uniref:electron transfer flavoprotein subunit alpha/FixB family protein n=1 Tax=Desulfospira joergensenii TaxID=53329 RepID=UPI0003B58B66|nr:electron transfer flavoprotein subunit alpha/FixB family protein [Desulfospira joergensenii]